MQVLVHGELTSVSKCRVVWVGSFFLCILSFYPKIQNFLEDTGKWVPLGACMHFWRLSYSPVCLMLGLSSTGHLLVQKKTVCSKQGVDVECPRFRSSASERSWGWRWFTLPKHLIASAERVWRLPHLFLIKTEVWIRTCFWGPSGRCEARIKK